MAGSVWAADPIIGTWKLNAAESESPSDFPIPTMSTIVYRELDNNLIEMSDGSPDSVKWTWPRQGGLVNTPPAIPKERMYIETLVEPGHWYATVMENGIQIGFAHKVVSKDGKKTRQKITILTPQGETLERTEILDRQ